MNELLSKSLANYLIKKIKASSESLQIKISGSQYSADVLIKALNNVYYSSQNSKCLLKIKIASQLFKSWSDDEQKKVRDEHCDWIDETGNLTSYRNEVASSSSGEKIALLIVGYDFVDDQSSLAHFIDANLDVIYKYEMKESFKSWIGEMDKQALDLMKAVYKFSDLKTIDSFLRNIEFNDSNKVFGEIGSNLYKLGLPCYIVGKGDEAKCLKEGINIINGSFAEEKTNVNRATKAVDALEESIRKALKDNVKPKNSNAQELINIKEYYPGYDNVLEYIEDCKKLLDPDCSDSVRDKIRKTDCYSLVELVFKKKEKKESTKTKEEIVTGLPYEAILSALWTALTSQIAESNKITSVRIVPNKFFHNLDLSENDVPNTGDISFVYNSLILPLFGGISKILETDVFSLLNEDDRPFENTEFSFNFDEDYWILDNVRHTNSIPFCTFNIIVKSISDDSDEEQEEVYGFKYEYRNESPVMYTLDLINNVREDLNQFSGSLPVVYFDKYSEIFDKADEEIGLFFSSEVGKKTAFRLFDLSKLIDMDSEFRGDIDLLFSDFYSYCKAFEDGFYHAIDVASSSFRNNYMNLLDRLSVISNSDSRYSSLKSVFIKSFWIVNPPKYNENEFDVMTSNHFGSGIITLLHPAMIDMVVAQTSYLSSTFVNTFWEFIDDPSSDEKNADDMFEKVIGFAKLVNPIPCMLDGDRKVKENRGSDLLYLFGSAEKEEKTRPASILCRYDDDIPSSSIKKASQHSSLICNLLTDYYEAYMMSKYSIRISVFLASDVQPIMAGLISFFKSVNKKKNEQKKDDKKNKPCDCNYYAEIYFYTTLQNEVNTNRWISTVNDFLLEEMQKESSDFSNIHISFFCKLADDSDRYVNSLNCDSDVILIYETPECVDGTVNWSEVKKIESSNYGMKFPLALKLLPRKKSANGSDDSCRRRSLLSNRQFSMYSKYLNYLYSMQNKIDEKNDVVLEEEVDFSSWSKLFEKCIDSSERVIAIGNNIDRNLISTICKDSAIIGSGTGLCANADLNYVVASKITSEEALRERLSLKFANTFNLNANVQRVVFNNLMEASDRMTGLSLIKTLSNKSLACHDFFGYSMIRHLLKSEEDCFADVLVSLDSYMHWFKAKSNRADLLWIRAKLIDTEDAPKFSFKFSVVESKLGNDVVNNLLDHAADQADDTCIYLKERFRREEDRYDSKYWWMQLHRILASNSVIGTTYNENVIKDAFENLSYGQFEVVSFDRYVIAFETSNCYGKEEAKLFTSKKRNVPELVITPVGVEHFMSSQNSPKLSDLFEMISSINESVKSDVDEDTSVKSTSNVIKSRERNKDTLITIESEEVDTMPMAANPVNDLMDSSPSAEEEIISNDGTDVSVLDDTDSIDTVKYDLNKCDPEPDVDLELDSNILPAGVGLYANSDAKIHLGRDIFGNSCDWLFGSDYKKMENKHMLVIGGSGSGKSYAIKCILYELAKIHQHSMIIDYTGGFTNSTLREESEMVGDSSLYKYTRPQYVVKRKPLPLNPFAMYKSEEDDEDGNTESTMDVAIRVVDIINHSYHFGAVQKGALMNLVDDKLKEFGSDFNMDQFGEMLKDPEVVKQYKNLASVASKLIPLYRTNIFANDINDQSFWPSIFNSDGSEKAVSVLQFSSVPDIVAYTCVDFLLWDLFNFCKYSKSRESTPHVIVLDEFQNLCLSSGSPVRKYLQEGRKYGLNLILATQTLSNIKASDGPDAVASLFNAANLLIFKPTAPDMKYVAAMLNSKDKSHTVDEWTDILSSLTKGECISITLDDETQTFVSRKIKITSMEER